MTEKLIELIEKYLDNQLTESEKTAFEYRIENEPEVEKAVNLIRLERLSVDLMFENDLRQKMREWKAENEANSKVIPKQGTSMLIRFGLLFILILSVIVILFYSRATKMVYPDRYMVSPTVDSIQKVESAKLDTTTYASLRVLSADSVAKSKRDGTVAMLSTPRSNRRQDVTNVALERLALDNYDRPRFNSGENRSTDVGEAQSTIVLAEKAFDESKFEMTLDIIGTLNNSKEADIQSLKGHALFSLRKFTDAEEAFTLSYELGNEEKREQAQWHRALCMLARGKRHEARVLLEKIVSEKEGMFKEKAKRVLLKMK